MSSRLQRVATAARQAATEAGRLNGNLAQAPGASLGSATAGSEPATTAGGGSNLAPTLDRLEAKLDRLTTADATLQRAITTLE